MGSSENETNSETSTEQAMVSAKPHAQTAMNEVSTDTGSARPVMTVERQELRNTNTTSTVRTAPSTSASSTFLTELATRTPASRTIRSVTPGGRRCWILATAFRMSYATAVVLNPFDLTT